MSCKKNRAKQTVLQIYPSKGKIKTEIYKYGNLCIIHQQYRVAKINQILINIII